MALVPAVYITLEDQSFTTVQPSISRTGFIVVMGDRGTHNRVVRIDGGPTEFHKKYGKPDLERNGLAHYLADRFLRSGGTLYIVRPVIVDSTNELENQSISNSYIRKSPKIDEWTEFTLDTGTHLYSTLGGTGDILTQPIGPYPSGFSNYISVTSGLYDQFDVGDLLDTDGNYAVASITHKFIETDLAFVGGPKTYYILGLSELPAPIVAGDTTTTVYKLLLANSIVPASTTVNGGFKFVNELNYIVAYDADSFASINIGDWITPSTTAYDLTVPVDGEIANLASVGVFNAQVVNKVVESSENRVVLNITYDGVDTNMAVSTTPIVATQTFQRVTLTTNFQIESVPNVRYADDEEAINFTSQLSTIDPDNLWYFHSIGVGSFYNDIYVVGVRNVPFEKIYVSADGTPTYKYAFIDLYVYQRRDDEEDLLLEDAVTVSLIRKTTSGNIITDINTNQNLYIEDVINDSSDYIRVKSSIGVETHLTSNSVTTATQAEQNRLEVQQLFARESVFRTDIVASDGIKLENGEDGTQYDEFGRLRLNSDSALRNIILQTYAHVLQSPDNSIENLHNTLYPRFKFDYIISGGYDADIQNAARELADFRQNSMLLADTGIVSSSAAKDITARNVDVPWNTFNAMIYVGYRWMADIYNGKDILMSPVYDAIERHLAVDDTLWIAEPVAGIEKGVISAPITLKYQPNFKQLEDLIEVELNPTLVEPDGTYILTQNTAYKRLSVLANGNVVKFIHFMRNELPSQLKDILQRKFTTFWINTASTRVNEFMSPYVETGGDSSDRFAILRSFSYQVIPNEVRSELAIIITINPLRTIQAITVNIVVR